MAFKLLVELGSLGLDLSETACEGVEIEDDVGLCAFENGGKTMPACIQSGARLSRLGSWSRTFCSVAAVGFDLLFRRHQAAPVFCTMLARPRASALAAAL